jgi:hypothetical protein
MNFQFRIITKIDNLVGRLAVQNRTFEAEGVDAVEPAIEEARKKVIKLKPPAIDRLTCSGQCAMK